jgi:hypothetical protein
MAELGMPACWQTAEKWLTQRGNIRPVPVSLPGKVGKKDWGLSSYTADPGKGFWKDYPSRLLPVRPGTRVRVPALRRMCVEAGGQWTIHQKQGAEKAVNFLQEGAPAYQSKYLKPLSLSNAPSIIEYGNIFTTTLSEWIEKGFVAGPFLSPPVADFRANSIMAEAQKDKVRPILNMSSPKNQSFNSNVDKTAVPKTHQSSAKKFSQTLLAVGKGAIISKMDMRDAFKLVPARIADLRLQGFRWLNNYFVDTQQIFGSTPSVSNFDRVAQTVLDIVQSRTSIPDSNVHRTLDDVVCVAQPSTGWCQEFSSVYKSVCGELDIPLAEDCPKLEKAFTNESRGIVLGVMFDANTLMWRLADQKIATLQNDIHNMYAAGHADLKQTERLVGRLNNFGQMSPLLATFRRPMNKFLASFGEDYEILLPVPEDFKDDLEVWYNVITDSKDWLPIPKEVENPPYGALYFTSDAAGGLGREEWSGVASLGHKEEKSFWFVCRGKWPESVYHHADEKGASLASKMTTLELIGLFLPLLSIPEKLSGRNIVLGVDNVSVVFAWENGSVSGDMYASALVRALHITAAFLKCRVFVRHVPRMSSLSSYMADSLTRQSTATAEVWSAVVGADTYGPPAVLWDWLANPYADWELGIRIVNSLKSKITSLM